MTAISEDAIERKANESRVSFRLLILIAQLIITLAVPTLLFVIISNPFVSDNESGNSSANAMGILGVFIGCVVLSIIASAVGLIFWINEALRNRMSLIAGIGIAASCCYLGFLIWRFVLRGV